ARYDIRFIVSRDLAGSIDAMRFSQTRPRKVNLRVAASAEQIPVNVGERAYPRPPDDQTGAVDPIRPSIECAWHIDRRVVAAAVEKTVVGHQTWDRSRESPDDLAGVVNPKSLDEGARRWIERGVGKAGLPLRPSRNRQKKAQRH